MAVGYPPNPAHVFRFVTFFHHFQSTADDSFDGLMNEHSCEKLLSIPLHTPHCTLHELALEDCEAIEEDG